MKHILPLLTALLLLASAAHAQTDPEFFKQRNLGDGCFARKDYACAERYYKVALIIKANDDYCKNQLKAIPQLRKAIADQRKKEETAKREETRQRQEHVARQKRADQQSQAQLEAEQIARKLADNPKPAVATAPTPTTAVTAVPNPPMLKPERTADASTAQAPLTQEVPNRPAPTDTPRPLLKSAEITQLNADMTRYRSRKNTFLGIAIASLAAGGATYLIASGKYSSYTTEVTSRNSTYTQQYASLYSGQAAPATDLLTPLSKGEFMGSSLAVAGGAAVGGVVFWLVSNRAGRNYRAARNRLSKLTQVSPLYDPAQRWAGLSLSMKF